MIVDRARRVTTPLRPFHWREASLATPAMALLMLAGILLHQPVAGATAAGAAFAVGFGAARELRGRRWGAMIAAMLGMTVAAFAGCLLGQAFWLFVPAAALAAAWCARLALRDENLWWVMLQVVVAFFVAGYYPGGLAMATERAVAVAGGGMIEIVAVLLLARLFPAAGQPTIAPATPDNDPGLRHRHAARAAICVALSLVAAHRLGLASSYWAPMTALLVLKPRLHETSARGIARLGGTLAGCGLATLYAHVCRDSELLLGIGMIAAALAAFALQKAHYASLTAAITATIVLLLTLGHSPALVNAEHRIAATLVGGGLALLVAALVPHHRPRLFVTPDRVGRAA